jgi:hypothetical protein
MWMAENLNYNANDSKCYDNDNRNCTQYGKLYNWETARTVCPKGWHLPSDTEWDILIKVIDRENHFAALLGGYGGSDGNFYDIGDFGFWWSATEHDAQNAYMRNKTYNRGYVRDNDDKKILFSVRCVKD